MVNAHSTRSHTATPTITSSTIHKLFHVRANFDGDKYHEDS